jgi:hypothetical protein
MTAKDHERAFPLACPRRLLGRGRTTERGRAWGVLLCANPSSGRRATRPAAPLLRFVQSGSRRASPQGVDRASTPEHDRTRRPARGAIADLLPGDGLHGQRRTVYTGVEFDHLPRQVYSSMELRALSGKCCVSAALPFDAQGVRRSDRPAAAAGRSTDGCGGVPTGSGGR